MYNFKFDLNQTIYYMGKPCKIVGRLVYKSYKEANNYYLVLTNGCALVQRDIDMWFDTEQYVDLEFVTDIQYYFGKTVKFVHENECRL